MNRLWPKESIWDNPGPDRRGYPVLDLMEFGADPTGTRANFDEVMTRAIARAQEMSTPHVTINMPSGYLRTSAPVVITNVSTLRTIHIRGQGSFATRILNQNLSGDIFQLGMHAAPTSTDYTRGLMFSGFTFGPTGAVSGQPAGFRLHGTSGVQFHDCYSHSNGFGWALGLEGLIDNDCIYTSMVNCGGKPGPQDTDQPMIYLGCGGTLSITGNLSRWDGGNSSNDFIRHEHTSSNWDGLYISDQIFESWLHYVISRGLGISNFEFTGGQVDRADIFFFAEPNPGVAGRNNNWNIHDTQILGNVAGSEVGGYGVYYSSGNSGLARNLRFSNNNVQRLGAQAVWTADNATDAMIVGNKFTSCGHGYGTPTSVLKIGGGATIIGNRGYYDPSDSDLNAYQNGIDWDNGPIADRSSTGNDWHGRLGAAEVGTM